MPVKGEMVNAVHEARFYETQADGRVLCTRCPHDCMIPGVRSGRALFVLPKLGDFAVAQNVA